jgi:hypothetical protein
MVSASIVNNTRQSPARNRIPAASEGLYITSAGFRERRQFGGDLNARGGRQLAPLAGGGRSKCDVFHIRIHRTSR